MTMVAKLKSFTHLCSHSKPSLFIYYSVNETKTAAKGWHNTSNSLAGARLLLVPEFGEHAQFLSLRHPLFQALMNN